eukprot:CAMPEP_0194160450 /NCGR_PEP_ID=MMETSP0152-20130528/78398_1 /TAXON_ID=1049557 /ORGANISM="Thalassiothrix antarctica, Strain L6-D1" /LENGTH=418 /DNA_ID=CAMNT_0038870141 /DNA_START=321 /DNA_END=1577 /DNA_ORIENTATION=+
MNHIPVWKFYFMGSPIVSLAGKRLVTKIQSLEFSKLTSSLQPAKKKKGKNNNSEEKNYSVYITDNINFQADKSKHRFLRSMIGSIMSPTALQSITPAIRNIAETFVEHAIVSGEGDVCMERICTDYTAELRDIYSLWVNSGILVRFTKAYKARKYLEAQITEQINHLKRGKPNASTLSNMVYAINEEEGQTRLTDKEVLENALFLVAAGTETSSSTLTLLVTALAINPRVWGKLIEESRAACNDDILLLNDRNRIIYEKLMALPYLDAVVNEALRIGSITGGFPRKVKETIVVDGYQIPKGWSVFGNYRLSHYLDPVTRNTEDPNDDSHMNIQTGFQPERWLSPETTPSEFLAFGAGPRYCLGSNLALLEMKMFMFVLTRKVDTLNLVVPKDKIKWNPYSIIPKPLDGAAVRISRRRH